MFVAHVTVVAPLVGVVSLPAMPDQLGPGIVRFATLLANIFKLLHMNLLFLKAKKEKNCATYVLSYHYKVRLTYMVL